MAADAAGYAAEGRRKVERLKAGENVDVGKPIDFHAIQKAAGLSEADIRHVQTVGALSEGGTEQYIEEASREHRQHNKRSERAIARRILRRDIAKTISRIPRRHRPSLSDGRTCR